MTNPDLHPLIQLLIKEASDKIVSYVLMDKIIRQFLTERSEWLKMNIQYPRVENKEIIDQAFCLSPKEEKKEWCECEKPKLCGEGTGFGNMLGSVDGFVECNLCHRCLKFIDRNYGATKPINPQPHTPTVEKWTEQEIQEGIFEEDRQKDNDIITVLNAFEKRLKKLESA